MLVQKELVGKIKDYFDLNMYETKVWLALLGKGVASAGQIAQISRVPRSRTYDVLESLEKKGFCIVKLGKPVKYLGVKPHVVLEKLKNNARTDAEEKIVTLSKLRGTDEFAKLENLYKEGINPVKRNDLSAAIRGKSNISNHLREILENSSREVIICTNAEDMNSKLKLFRETVAFLKKANVKTKIALSGDERLIAKIENTLQTKIKHVDIDAKFFIIDKKEMLFYISKDVKSNQEDTAIWLNSEFFAQAFGDLFEKAIGGNK